MSPHQSLAASWKPPQKVGPGATSLPPGPPLAGGGKSASGLLCFAASVLTPCAGFPFRPAGSIWNRNFTDPGGAMTDLLFETPENPIPAGATAGMMRARDGCGIRYAHLPGRGPPAEGHGGGRAGAQRIDREIFRDRPRPVGPRLRHRRVRPSRPGRLRPHAARPAARLRPRFSPVCRRSRAVLRGDRAAGLPGTVLRSRPFDRLAGLPDGGAPHGQPRAAHGADLAAAGVSRQVDDAAAAGLRAC